MHTCARALTRCTALRSAASYAQCSRLSALHCVNHHRRYSTVSAADLSFGQPIHETHPHLLSPGELTPGIQSLEYAQRRDALARQLPKGGIAILASATVKYKSRDVFYPFHQDSNFLYLTGFLEPDSLAIITRPADGEGHEFHLYLRDKNPKEEQWSGPRSGVQAAYDVFNADYASDIETSTPRAKETISSATKIFTDIPTAPTSSPPSLLSRLTNLSSSSSSSTTSLLSLLSSHRTIPLSPILHPLRAFKSPAELSLLRHIGRGSGRAITETIRAGFNTRYTPGPPFSFSATSPTTPSNSSDTSDRGFSSESHLSSVLHSNLSHHSLSPAYIPVLAGSPRSRCIHYTLNSAPLTPSSLLLIDAGGELGNYVTDITRIYPNSGVFTPPQRDLYTAVLNVQRHCLSLCRATAAISLDDLHATAEKLLSEELSQLGFPTSGYAGKRRMTELFPHHVGHYVGMDVHDTPTVSRQRKLEAGMVVSVEPGVYVPDEPDMPERFRGMGVRVEDTVAIGETGPMVMSAEAVKEVEDIEALRD